MPKLLAFHLLGTGPFLSLLHPSLPTGGPSFRLTHRQTLPTQPPVLLGSACRILHPCAGTIINCSRLIYLPSAGALSYISLFFLSPISEWSKMQMSTKLFIGTFSFRLTFYIPNSVSGVYISPL